MPADLLARETGRKAVPRRHERKAEWLLALAEHEAALERAGLPPCEWMKAFVREPGPPAMAGFADHLAEDGGEWIVFVAACVLLGPVVGHAWVGPWRLDAERARTRFESRDPS